MTLDLMKQAIASLYPKAQPNIDYTATVDSAGNASILLWNNALGPQPTDAQLASSGGNLTLSAAKTAQSAAVEAAYENATFATAIAYKSTTFWADEKSQFLLLGAVVGYQSAGATPPGFAWWDATNTAQPMSLSDLQGLYQAIMLRLNTNFAKRKTLLGQIAAATTVADVQAVNW